VRRLRQPPAAASAPAAADEDERALFREAVRDARPLQVTPRVTPPAPKLPPVPVQSLLDEHAALAEARGAAHLADALIDGLDEASYARPGVGRDVLRKLRRGQWTVQRELDLHGATRDSARVLMGEFIAQAGADGVRCVRIIHGKGLGSPRREPVLRGLARKWLARHPQVVAYCEAPAAQGGAGALLVLLQ